MRLYEMTGMYLTLQEMMEDESVDQSVILDTMEGLTGEIEEKAESYGKIIRGLEEDVNGIKEETVRLEQKKKSLERNIGFLKRSLEKSMIAMDKKKIKTPLFIFSVQKNAPSLEIINENDIPAEFWVAQEPKLDKKSLLVAVKESPKKFEGIATTKQSESLRIR